MSNSIKLIVGLGNPGSEYQATRHNAGAWFVERLAEQNRITLSPDKKFYGYCGRGKIGDDECWLLLPTTFMNLSGQAIAALAQFYKIRTEQIIIAHDDLDLPPGTAKLKFGGGHGGQNGLRDAISKLGNDANFHRLRIGIGHPGHKSQVTGYVLGKASKTEQNAIDAAICEAIHVLPDVISGNMAKAMNRLHSFKG
ncbi:MAG: aminoacyl-tRNA hydrolase [Bacterioplanes sp.]|nr:aminoacyl-tRNA hydrolase [Bacterioplanes sp.]